MSIDERRDLHQTELRKLNDKKTALENKLGSINDKIAYHWNAVQNLTMKKLKHNKEE